METLLPAALPQVKWERFPPKSSCHPSMPNWDTRTRQLHPWMLCFLVIGKTSLMRHAFFSSTQNPVMCWASLVMGTEDTAAFLWLTEGLSVFSHHFDRVQFSAPLAWGFPSCSLAWPGEPLTSGGWSAPVRLFSLFTPHPRAPSVPSWHPCHTGPPFDPASLLVMDQVRWEL